MIVASIAKFEFHFDFVEARRFERQQFNWPCRVESERREIGGNRSARKFEFQLRFIPHATRRSVRFRQNYSQNYSSIPRIDIIARLIKDER